MEYDISSEIPYFKKVVKSRVFSGFYICPLASAFVISTQRRLLSKYHTPAKLDQPQKNWTRFVNFFTNPTGESRDVICK